MDKWTEKQIERMKKGGNSRCREFFEANGQPFMSLPMTEKVRRPLSLLAPSSLPPPLPLPPSLDEHA